MLKLIGWILIGIFFILLVVGRLTEDFHERFSKICAYIAILSFIVGRILVFCTIDPCPHVVEEQYMPINYP